MKHTLQERRCDSVILGAGSAGLDPMVLERDVRTLEYTQRTRQHGRASALDVIVEAEPLEKE